MEYFERNDDNIFDESCRHGYYQEVWNQNYQKFKDYYSTFGTTNVPEDYVTEDGCLLGAWVVYQRAKKRNGLLSIQHEKLLNQAFMIWNLHDEKFDIGYDKLVDYYEKYGNVDVTPSFVTEDGYKLGIWLVSFREAYKGKNKRRLDHDQIAMFNDLFIDWSKRDTRILNSEIVQGCCFDKYKKVGLLEYTFLGGLNDHRKKI